MYIDMDSENNMPVAEKRAQGEDGSDEITRGEDNDALEKRQLRTSTALNFYRAEKS
jgi:hypothetical protein